MQIRNLVCATCVSVVISACGGGGSSAVETPPNDSVLGLGLSTGALGENRALLWDCTVFSVNAPEALPIKQSITFGDNFQGVDSSGLTYAWSVSDDDSIQANYLDVATTVQLSSIEFTASDRFHAESITNNNNFVETGQLACVKSPGNTFSTDPGLTRISSEQEFRNVLVGQSLYLVHNNIESDISIDGNGKITGSITFIRQLPRQYDIDWVWDTNVNTYCRSGLSGTTALNYECEYVDLIPGAGVRFTYLNNQGSGAGAVEYWTFEQVD